MHDVFPKARFRDCIAMTQQLGNKGMIPVLRKEWIDQSRPRRRQHEQDPVDKDELEDLSPPGNDGDMALSVEITDYSPGRRC